MARTSVLSKTKDDAAPTPAEILLRIEAQAVRVERKRREMEEVALELKQVKSEYEAERGRLERMARKSDEPLFAEPEEKDWATVSVNTLGLPHAITTALEEAKLGTIGAIAAYCKDGKDLTEVDRIGQAAAEKILAALDVFWEKQKLTEETEPDDGADNDPA